MKGVTGAVLHGRVPAVMGPSGSGKTTLLLCVSGAATPTSGSVEVNGAPFDAGTMRRVASFVPQDDLLTPCLTVEESLREAVLFKTGHASDSLECDQKVNELAERFGLVDCLTTPVGRPGEGKRGASGGRHVNDVSYYSIMIRMSYALCAWPEVSADDIMAAVPTPQQLLDWGDTGHRHQYAFLLTRPRLPEPPA